MKDQAKRFLFDWMYTNEALSFSDRVTYVVGDIISLNWHGTLEDILCERMIPEKWHEIVTFVKGMEESEPIMEQINYYEKVILDELERKRLYVRV